MSYRQNYIYLNCMSDMVKYLSEYFGIETNDGVPMWRKMFYEQKETFYMLHSKLKAYNSLQNKYLYPDNAYWDKRRNDTKCIIDNIIAPYIQENLIYPLIRKNGVLVFSKGAG